MSMGTKRIDWSLFVEAPVFVINLDRRSDRWGVVQSRLIEAGFVNVYRVRGVDGSSSSAVNSLPQEWAAFGSPKFDPIDPSFVNPRTGLGKQGCTLSHLNLLALIVEKRIPLALVFEDDVRFHEDWHRLAPLHLSQTPASFDLLYLGARFGLNIIPKRSVCQAPVMCLHAYAVTCEGAALMLRILLGQPAGIRSIDLILSDYQFAVHKGNLPRLLKWWVWTGIGAEESHFREGAADFEIVGGPFVAVDTGLVFQDTTLGSDIQLSATPSTVEEFTSSQFPYPAVVTGMEVR